MVSTISVVPHTVASSTLTIVTPPAHLIRVPVREELLWYPVLKVCESYHDLFLSLLPVPDPTLTPTIATTSGDTCRVLSTYQDYYTHKDTCIEWYHQCVSISWRWISCDWDDRESKPQTNDMYYAFQSGRNNRVAYGERTRGPRLQSTILLYINSVSGMDNGYSRTPAVMIM